MKPISMSRAIVQAYCSSAWSKVGVWVAKLDEGGMNTAEMKINEQCFGGR